MCPISETMWATMSGKRKRPRQMYLHTVFTQRNNVFLVLLIVTTLINHILKKSRGKNQREELFEIWRRREWDSSCSEFLFKVSHPSTKLYLLHFYNIMCFINVFQSFFLYEMLVWNCKDEFPIEKKKHLYCPSVQVSCHFWSTFYQHQLNSYF